MTRNCRRGLAAFAWLSLVVGGPPAIAHDDDVRIHGVAVGTQSLKADRPQAQ